MNIDIYSSGGTPSWYLVKPAGTSYQLQVDDVVTGVANMLPLAPYMMNVESQNVLVEKFHLSVEHDLPKYGGAVIKATAFLSGLAYVIKNEQLS